MSLPLRSYAALGVAWRPSLPLRGDAAPL